MKTQCIIRRVSARHTRHADEIRQTMNAVKSIPVEQKYIKAAADMMETAMQNTQSEYIDSFTVCASYVMRYTVQLVKEGKISITEDPEADHE